MKIQPNTFENHAILRKADQAVFEQATVVRFEVDFTFFWQNLLKSIQERLIGQATFFMPFLRPWIREIQVKSVNFSICKIVGQFRTIHPEQLNIGYISFQNLVQGVTKDRLLNVNPDVINIWISLSHPSNESSFTASNFNMDRMVVSKNFPPFSLGINWI